jgi:hypothetical protein
MGILRSSKPSEAKPVADREAASPEASWVRLGAEGLWAGVLPDDALGSLPVPAEVEEDRKPTEREPETTHSDGDEVEHALSRPQEPGTPEFRILCGARTPNDIRRRFGWKTDKELSECYEIALEEQARATGDGDRAEIVYWDALVRASVQEAVNRPNFGELTEWEAADGRREKRESLRRLNILAKAREDALRAGER